MPELNRDRVVELLNRILEAELAGVVRYTHYSFLVYGYNRIPIVSWLREQASESLLHAQQAGEMITHLGAYPSLRALYGKFAVKLVLRVPSFFRLPLRRRRQGRSQGPMRKHGWNVP
jgi:bacterioferritin (cytochrome b1)